LPAWCGQRTLRILSNLFTQSPVTGTLIGKWFNVSLFFIPYKKGLPVVFRLPLQPYQISMKFKLSAAKHYSTGIKLLLAFIIIVLFVSVYETNQVIKTGRLITNTQEVLQYSKKILTLALDNESRFRGYMLTGQKNLLAPLEKSQKEIYEGIDKLKALTSNNHVQQIRSDSLSFYVEKRIVFSNSTIKIYEAEGVYAARKLVETGEGTLYTDRIRLLVDEIQDTENGLLIQHKDANNKSVRNLQWFLLLITACIVLLLVVFIRKVRADNVEKGIAAAALKKINDELEQRVIERTQELNKKEKLFRALVENNEGIISLIDEKLNVLFRSSSTDLITGSLLGENEKFSVAEFIHPDDVLNIKALITEALANPGKTIPVSTRLKHKDGHYIWLEGVIKNMIHDPAIGGIITNLQDISSRIEEEMRVSKAIIDTQEQERQYIGAELHDNVNQVLASSLLVLGMIKTEKMDSESAIEFIETGIEYISNAIEELRKLSHELAPASFDDSTLKDAFENLLQGFNVNNQFKIKFNFDKKCNSVNDEIQINLYRILQEQIKNIGKYAEARQIEIAVTRSGGAINLRIFDNGKGFDLKTVKNGIGLSNIKKRAESLSGKFILNSAPGKGCEIIVVIPCDAG
jgi:PAS domain S-box-containing protein